jgi:hypothetical protein
MEAQQIFDTVVAHLRQQKSKALSDVGSCMYRSDDGKKCAAGCLMTDEEYAPGMEGNSIGAILASDARSNGVSIPCPTSLFEKLGQHASLIRKLQIVHDSREVKDWEDGLAIVARQYNLTYTPPTT